MIKLDGNYTLIIGIEIIGNSNYIRTILSGFILEEKEKEKPIQLKIYIF